VNGVRGMRSNTLLPLPRWVLHPYTALVLAGVHLYLAGGHLLPLFDGEIQRRNYP
jgi:hypothetical protein